MKGKVFLTVLILLVCGCKKKEMHINDKPDWVISEDQMVDMIVDIRIADAAVYINQKTLPRDKAADLTFIMKKYHTNDSIFDKSHDYYAEHPEVAENIYERVIDRLSEMVANNSEGQ